MSHGFVFIGVLLLIVLMVVRRLAHLNGQEFRQALYSGNMMRAHVVGKQGSHIFKLEVLSMLAMLVWCYRLFNLMGVI